MEQLAVRVEHGHPEGLRPRVYRDLPQGPVGLAAGMLERIELHSLVVDVEIVRIFAGGNE